MKRSTILDVAKVAKVSVSTVSHVVNRTRHVEPDTNTRVQKAIEQLNYVPNSIAQALKSDRTKTIGMIVASSTNPFFAQVIHGVGEECNRLGFSLILANCGDKLSLLTSHLQTLLAKRIDGLIVMTTNSSIEFFDHITGIKNIPVVAIDTEKNKKLCTVNDDSFYGGSLVGRYLAENKIASKIFCIAGPTGHPSSDLRCKGFLEGLSAFASPIDKKIVFHARDLGLHDGYTAMNEILATHKFPLSVFAINDLLAIGAISAVHQAGLRVPQDISIVGYDDIEMAAYTSPPLTTVHQKAENLGRMAADLVIKNFGKILESSQSITLTSELIKRQST
jgi:LacI family transcriptional regulator